jgi:hypothetical protein
VTGAQDLVSSGASWRRPPVTVAARAPQVGAGDVLAIAACTLARPQREAFVGVHALQAAGAGDDAKTTESFPAHLHGRSCPRLDETAVPAVTTDLRVAADQMGATDLRDRAASTTHQPHPKARPHSAPFDHGEFAEALPASKNNLHA